MNYLKYLILLMLLVAGAQGQTFDFKSDTLESNSSDSVFTMSIKSPTQLVKIAMKQLDTNGVTSPDSARFYDQNESIEAPVDFNSTSGDSLFSNGLSFTYSSTGQIREGWLWQPAMTGLKIVMSNAVFRSNRKVLIEVTAVYY